MDKGANAGAKICSLVAGMAAGADSIEDMAVLRHGAMSRILEPAHAPSTLGSFLRGFIFGHVRKLDAVASRFLTALAAETALLGGRNAMSPVMVDVDDTIVEVHGYKKQGASFGYSEVRGLNALLATMSTDTTAPVVVAQRLRKGSCGSSRGVARLICDALATVGRTHLAGRQIQVRADSAFYSRALVGAAIKAGAQVSVTAGMTHRRHAVIENVHADLKASALEHPPSGVFTANAAWLVCAVMAFNLTCRLSVRRVSVDSSRSTTRRTDE